MVLYEAYDEENEPNSRVDRRRRGPYVDHGDWSNGGGRDIRVGRERQREEV